MAPPSPPRPSGALAVPTLRFSSEFQAAHCGYCPCHFRVCAPQGLHAKTPVARTMGYAEVKGTVRSLFNLARICRGEMLDDGFVTSRSDYLEGNASLCGPESGRASGRGQAIVSMLSTDCMGGNPRSAGHFATGRVTRLTFHERRGAA